VQLSVRARRGLMLGAWSVFVLAGAMLAGLLIGRPIYYTDGREVIGAAALTSGSMLRWRSPDAWRELPGPVAGRVARLPDGRLIYGRVGDDGTSDLVLFDPEAPDVPPEPAHGLNSRDNDVAPAVGNDGSIWFASDRAGGRGGYDLYVARPAGRGFGPAEPVLACNTALDETDPAPGRDLVVFVRIDPAERAGHNGTLWRWRQDADTDATTVFATTPERCTDRDPVFDASASALWFVRRVGSGPLTVVRSSWLGDESDAPVDVSSAWRGRTLRSPIPVGGRRLLCVAAEQASSPSVLVYAAGAEELVPWWPGQRWLEQFLLAAMALAALLLLLLYFGQRWQALDLVTQCLLLSVLLHVLVLLWIMGVEIAGSLRPGDDQLDDGLVVGFVAAADAAAASAAAAQQALVGVEFAPSERALTAVAPGAWIQAANPVTAAPAAALPAANAAATQRRPEPVPLADAAAEFERRAALDVVASLEAHDAPAVEAPAPAPAAARRAPAATGDAVVLVLPDTALPAPAGAASGRAIAAPAAVPPVLAGAAHATPVRPTTLRDTNAPPADRVATSTTDAPAEVQLEPVRAATAADGEASGPAAASIAVQAPLTASADARSLHGGDPVPLPPTATPMAARALPVVAPRALVGPPVPAPQSATGWTAALAAPRDAAMGVRTPDPQPVARATPAASTPVPPVSALPVHGPTGPDTVALPSQLFGAAPAYAAAPAVAMPRALPAPAASLPAATRSAAATITAAPRPAAASRPLPTPRALGAATAPAIEKPVERAAATPSTNEGRARPTPLVPLASLPLAAAAVPVELRIARHSTAGSERSFETAPTPPATSVPHRAVDALPRARRELPPVATPYGNRHGAEKAAAIERFGGSVETERAVADGLAYLARIQNKDGSWGNRRDFDDKYGLVYVGKSALCVLAFLGAGHTPSSGTEHSEVVAKALRHLLSLQEPDTGAFGRSSCYGHGIATYALAECYGMTKDQALLPPLEAALAWILANQGPRRDARNEGGWGYFSPGLRREDDYARVSVSAWMVMSLEAARLGGVDVPTAALTRARDYLERSFDKANGWFRYNHKPSRLRSAWPTLPASTPAGAFCLMLLGVGPDDARVRAAVGYTAERRPERYRRYRDDDFVLRGQGNVYFWYYGTLACFLAGGDAWQQWNERLRTVLPASQSPDGSFAPIDVYAEEAGDDDRDRSYTTAMCVLCLEVYYRYFTPLLLGR
jgi:hypothetical protein